MKDMELLLKTVSDGLKSLARGIEMIADKVEDMSEPIQEAEAPLEQDTKPAETINSKSKSEKTEIPQPIKEKRSAVQIILQMITNSRNGIQINTIRKKTNYDSQKIHNIVYKLKKQGKIKSEKKGYYQKA